MEAELKQDSRVVAFPTGLTQPSTGCIYRNAVLKISRATVTYCSGLLFAVSQAASEQHVGTSEPPCS